ncbi:hypothetical protein REPUB_Repub01dG0257800 [Reevesia pubescens]
MPKADIASIKQEAAIMKLPDVATDAAPLAFIDHVIAKPPIWIFGTNVSDEVTSKAHFKTEVQETEISQAAGEAYYKSRTESLRLGFVLEQSTPYVGKLNLDLTLAPPIVDGGQD